MITIAIIRYETASTDTAELLRLECVPFILFTPAWGLLISATVVTIWVVTSLIEVLALAFFSVFIVDWLTIEVELRVTPELSKYLPRRALALLERVLIRSRWECTRTIEVAWMVVETCASQGVECCAMWALICVIDVFDVWVEFSVRIVMSAEHAIISKEMVKDGTIFSGTYAQVSCVAWYVKGVLVRLVTAAVRVKVNVEDEEAPARIFVEFIVELIVCWK